MTQIYEKKQKRMRLLPSTERFEKGRENIFELDKWKAHFEGTNHAI